MLYLLKGSRVREYHQQNVSILGAAEGEHVSISYGPRWVQSDLVVNIGDACVLVFADSPYDTFVPVRFAIVTRVDRPDDRLDVEVRLGTFVRAGTSDLLTQRWGRYDREDLTRPGRVFAVEDENPGLLSPRSLDEQDEAWREAVDGLAGNGYYDRSTVAKVGRIVDARGAELAPGHAVRVGEPLQVELELRTPTADRASVGLFVDADPEGGVSIDATAELTAQGTATIEVTPTVAGELTVQLGLLPEPLLSSRPFFAVTAVGEPVDASARTPSSPSFEQALMTSETSTLITRLRRDAEITPEVWFGLHEDLFLRWDGDDEMVLRDFARTAYDVDRFADCASALDRLGARRRPEDDFLFLLASLRAGHPVELDPLLQRIDLQTDRDFDRLLGALDTVDPAMLEQLTTALINDVLGEDKQLRFLDAVFPRLGSLNVALDVAEKAAYADPDRGADLLMSRWANASAAPEAVVRLLVEWGLRPNRLGPYLDRAIRLAESAEDWPEIERLAKQSRQLLGPLERGRLLAQAGETLMLSGNPPTAEIGFSLLAEVVADAAGRGDLDAAVRHAEALTGFAAIRGDDGLIAAATDLNETVIRAMNETKALREWREMQDDKLTKELANRLNGRVLHLVGGRCAPWRKELEITVGFQEVCWHETEKRGSNNTDWANGLDGERDIVIVLWEHIGHAISVPLKDKCTRKKVPRVESMTSLHDVLAALAQFVTP